MPSDVSTLHRPLNEKKDVISLAVIFIYQSGSLNLLIRQIVGSTLYRLSNLPFLYKQILLV